MTSAIRAEQESGRRPASRTKRQGMDMRDRRCKQGLRDWASEEISGERRPLRITLKEEHKPEAFTKASRGQGRESIDKVRRIGQGLDFKWHP